MGRSLTTLALIVAIVLAVALLVPALTDWEEQRASLEAQLAQVVGGPVALAGPVSVRLLPSPRLTAARVSLADGEGRLVIEGASLHAELSLWPLFANRVVVTRISLAGGEIRLSGGIARARALADELAARMSLGASAFDYVIAPDRLVLGEGEASIVLDAPRADVSWAGDDTPLRLGLRASEDLHADITFRPQADGSWRVNARGAYREDVVEFSANGVLEGFDAGAGLTGDFSLVADDTYRALGLESEGLESEGLEGQRADEGPAFSLHGAFQAHGAAWVAEETKFSLGTMQATVDLRGETGEQLALTARFTSALVDLDALGFEMGAVRDYIGAMVLGDRAASLVPGWVQLQASADVDGVVLNDRVARGISLALSSHGTLSLDGFEGSLPGATAISFHRPQERASLSLRAGSLRSLLSWIDVDVSAIPEDKLQELALEATMSVAPLRVEVRTLALDGGDARGHVEIDQAGTLSIAAEFEGFDLDAYTPGIEGSFMERARALAERAGAHEAVNYDLTGENVKLAGASLNRFRLLASSADEAFEFEQAEMNFTNGGRLSATGRWSLDDAPFDLTIEGVGVEPGFFEGLPLAPTAPADLTLSVGRSGAGLRLSGTVRTAGLEIDIAGQEREGDAFQGRFIARGQTEGALARALDLDVFAQRQGAELLDVQWAGPLTGGEVSLRLELAGLSALARGTAADVFSDHPQADVSVGVLARSTGDIVTQLTGPDLGALQMISLNGTGRLRLDETGWRFESERMLAGELPIAFDLVGGNEVPLSGRVEIERLALAQRQEREAEGTLAWSTASFELGWMEDASADLEVAIGALSVGRIPFKNVGFRMTATPDVIFIDQAHGTMGDGLLTGSATITRDDAALLVVADVAGEGIPATDLFGAVGLPATAGALTVASHLEARGRSPFDLVAGLDGRLDVGMNEGALGTVNLSRLEAALPTVRTRLSLREAARQAVASGETKLVRLAGTVPLSRGVLSLDGLEGIAETGGFALDGSLDLRSQIVDVEATFQISDADFGPSPVIVAFRGVGGELSTSIDISALQDTLGPRLADTPQGLLSEEDLPQDLRELLQAYEAAYPEGEDTAAP